MSTIDVQGSVKEYSETLRRIGEAMLTSKPDEVVGINAYREWVDDDRGDWWLEIKASIVTMGVRMLAVFRYQRPSPVSDWRLMSVEAETTGFASRGNRMPA